MLWMKYWIGLWQGRIGVGGWGWEERRQACRAEVVRVGESWIGAAAGWRWRSVGWKGGLGWWRDGDWKGVWLVSNLTAPPTAIPGYHIQSRTTADRSNRRG